MSQIIIEENATISVQIGQIGPLWHIGGIQIIVQENATDSVQIGQIGTL